MKGPNGQQVDEVLHTKDEDCDVDPETNNCRVCGVYHGDPCAVCGGRGFHRPWCMHFLDESIAQRKGL